MIFIKHRAGIRDLRDLNEKLHAEIDVRYVDGAFYIGHDEPEEELEYSELKDVLPFLWVHCKNIEAYRRLLENHENEIKFFVHNADDFAVVKGGYYWTTEPKALILPGTVLMDVMGTGYLPETMSHILSEAYAICSDYLESWRAIYGR